MAGARLKCNNRAHYRDCPVVRVHMDDGVHQWGHQVDESPVWVRLAFPLPSSPDDPQIITIPWANIRSIHSENEEDAPWNK